MIPTPAEAESAFQSIVALERDYRLQNYARYPLALRRGRGAYVYDLDGKRYLDFIAGIGVNALGHAHPRVVKVIGEQAALLIHCSNLYYHEYQVPLAGKLAEGYNALLILDEIQCGVGRTGAYFAYQWGSPIVLPDVIVLAKPLGCALPLGAIVANEKAAATIGLGMHGSTFAGSALACRVALEFFDILEELLPSIDRVGGYFRSALG